MLSRNVLMNNFLESFLLVFGKNKYTNLKKYWTIFCHETDSTLYKVVKSTFEYNGYKTLIKDN